MKFKIAFGLVLLVFLYFFAVFYPRFEGPDQPIYYAYVASLVEDGDLNAVNHLDESYPYYLPSGKIGVSLSYNLPDFHNHGGVLLWAPFYLYAKFLFFLEKKFSLLSLKEIDFDDWAHCLLSFSTIGLGFLALLITFVLSRNFFSPLVSLFSIGVIFWGTPFFYYMLFEPGNANIIATFFSALLILFGYHLAKMNKWGWFIYGIFLSISITVKVDLWPYLLFIVFLFLMLKLQKQVELKSALFFLFGLMPGLILKSINDYIKYGCFHIGELGMLNLNGSYFWDQLFSSYRGFFYTSPIFFLCFLGLLIISYQFFKRERKDVEKIFKLQFLFALFLILLIKIYFLSKRYAWGGGTAGARPLLVDFPIFVLLYGYFIQRHKSKLIGLFMLMVSITFIFWNMLVISEYMIGVDMKYLVQAPALLERMGNLRYILNELFSLKELGLKLKLSFLPSLLIISLSYYILRFQFNGKESEKPVAFRWFFIFTIYLITAYTAVTLLNLVNNQRNVRRLMQEGFYQNAELLKPEEYEKMENYGSMVEMINYFSLIGDWEEVERIERLKEELYGE